MKVRTKTGSEGTSGNFNMASLSEVIVGFDDGFQDTFPIRELDVWISQKKYWLDLRLAFDTHEVIIDNHNRSFFEPISEEDRKRGYTLW